jgi:hypothetical protein
MGLQFLVGDHIRIYNPFLSISPQVYYKKLIAHGFRSYIPINKFDVFQSLGKIELAADRRRYYRETIEQPVLISRDGIRWINGKIIDKSLVGFGIVTQHKFPITKGLKY